MSQIKTAAAIRCFSAADKAASGCVLHIRHDGRLETNFGIERPGEQASLAPSQGDAVLGGDAVSDEEKTADDDVPAGAGLSGALAQTVSEWLTVAAARTLAADPDVALRIVVASLQAHYSVPARISLTVGMACTAPRSAPSPIGTRASVPASPKRWR